MRVVDVFAANEFDIQKSSLGWSPMIDIIHAIYALTWGRVGAGNRSGSRLQADLGTYSCIDRRSCALTNRLKRFLFEWPP